MIPGVVTRSEQLCYNKNRAGSYAGHCGYFFFFFDVSLRQTYILHIIVGDLYVRP